MTTTTTTEELPKTDPTGRRRDRTTAVSVAVSPGLRDSMRAAATAEGLTLSGYVRALHLDRLAGAAAD